MTAYIKRLQETDSYPTLNRQTNEQQKASSVSSFFLSILTRLEILKLLD